MQGGLGATSMIYDAELLLRGEDASVVAEMPQHQWGQGDVRAGLAQPQEVRLENTHGRQKASRGRLILAARLERKALFAHVINVLKTAGGCYV